MKYLDINLNHNDHQTQESGNCTFDDLVLFVRHTLNFTWSPQGTVFTTGNKESDNSYTICSDFFVFRNELWKTVLEV